MEWAVAGGKVFVLQSRPITVMAPAPTAEDRQVWTNANSGEVLPGEVLVAPFTDPGWMLYFLQAAGIVVLEMGGMLSQGSIIVREYGIPAVVNVGPATRIIKTGQMIRVDANRGSVTVLAGGPGS